MKTKHWKHAAAVLFIMSVLLPLGAQVSDAASKYVELEMQWEDGRTTHIETLHKDGVTYGSLFSLGNLAGLRWGMENDNTAVLKRDQKRIVVHMGSSIAEVDGREVDMGREPVWYISNLYVPIRFLASALDGEVANRDTKTGKVTVTGLNNYKDTFNDSMMGYSYMIRAAKGDLEITNAYTGQKHSIPLGIKDINVNTHDLTFNFKRSPRNLLILSIEYTNRKTGDYDLYALVFKNQGLIRKSIAHGLMEPHEILKSDGTIQLLDDKIIRIIDDGSGNVLNVMSR
ncbi:stalk domain-containing protein [Paenibacillus sp. 843]|uniref:stalk domain-containing protein n=1 Tax=Paenibacillus sp. 843 TaxID=3341795 RepID=UPI003726A8A8